MALVRIIRHPMALVSAVALLIAGCIVSGQFVILLSWGGIVSTDTTVNSDHIDLTDNDTWQDHKDDIQSIVDVKFEVTIINHAGTVASGEVYMSATSYSTVADIQANAIRILHGIEVNPGATRKIEFSESGAFQENLAEALDLLETGEFYIYGIAAGTPFHIEIPNGSRLLITFSAG